MRESSINIVGTRLSTRPNSHLQDDLASQVVAGNFWMMAKIIETIAGTRKLLNNSSCLYTCFLSFNFGFRVTRKRAE